MITSVPTDRLPDLARALEGLPVILTRTRSQPTDRSRTCIRLHVTLDARRSGESREAWNKAFLAVMVALGLANAPGSVSP